MGKRIVLILQSFICFIGFFPVWCFTWNSAECVWESTKWSYPTSYWNMDVKWQHPFSFIKYLVEAQTHLSQALFWEAKDYSEGCSLQAVQSKVKECACQEGAVGITHSQSRDYLRNVNIISNQKIIEVRGNFNQVTDANNQTNRGNKNSCSS